MKLSEAISDYVARRRTQGLLFVSGASMLRLLCVHCGDLCLIDLAADQVASFVHSPKIGPVTRKLRYSVVMGFLKFCRVRMSIPLLHVAKPMQVRESRLPYIYTGDQIRSLLTATTKLDFQGDEIDSATLRMILLTFYATGATVGEIVKLQRLNVDLRRKSIEFTGSARNMGRTLPIGRDFHRELGIYIRTHCKNTQEALLFRFKSGRAINRGNLWSRFGRLCRLVGIPVSRDGHVPRLHDFRATFAVHRLSSAIRAGQNLNELIPALSTYLGSSELTRAEHFLSFIPERFSADLEKLSSIKPRTHWRDKPELLGFLDSL